MAPKDPPSTSLAGKTAIVTGERCLHLQSVLLWLKNQNDRVISRLTGANIGIGQATALYLVCLQQLEASLYALMGLF